MKKKVFLFSRDPGGANTIVPLFYPLIAQGYDVSLWGKDIALDKYTQAGLCGRDIMSRLGSVDLPSVREFLASESPDVIVTGTSAEDPCEKYIWKSAEELRIGSLAILDQWLNYGVRFSSYPSSKLAFFRNDRRFEFMPDKILLMDELARREALADGLPAERLEVTGQPHFQALASKPRSDSNKLSEVKTSWNIGADEMAVVFASEPMTEIWGSQPEFGYTELTIIRNLLEALEVVAASAGKKICLVVRPHPREDRVKLEQVVGWASKMVRVVVTDTYSTEEVVCAADLVCGMSSMFLLESAFLDTPTISIQIGLKTESLFVLDRSGVLKSVFDKATLVKSLQLALIDRKHNKVCMPFLTNSIENVISQVERCLSKRRNG
jgi:hypothetical protein